MNTRTTKLAGVGKFETFVFPGSKYSDFPRERIKVLNPVKDLVNLQPGNRYVCDYSQHMIHREDADATAQIRACKGTLHRTVQMKQLRYVPFRMPICSPGLLLPLSNSRGLDYLTDADPDYWAVMTEIARDAIRAGYNENACSQMLVNYSKYCPQISRIVRTDDGAHRIPWPEDVVKGLERFWDEWYRFAYAQADVNKIHVDMKVDKSIGMIRTLPDGSIFNTADAYLVNEFVKETALRTFRQRYNKPFKDMWQGSVDDCPIEQYMLEYLEDIYKCGVTDASNIVRRLQRGWVNVQTIALRSNCPDGLGDDSMKLLKSTAALSGSKLGCLAGKNRVQNIVTGGRLDEYIVDMSAASAKIFSEYGKEGAPNRIRGIMPSSILTQIPFIIHYKIVLAPIYDSAQAYPSLKPDVLRRWRHFMDCHREEDGWHVYVVNSDGKNNERRITDTFDVVNRLTPKEMRDMERCAAASVYPGEDGPYAAINALTSGQAGTTAYTCKSGSLDEGTLFKTIVSHNHPRYRSADWADIIYRMNRSKFIDKEDWFELDENLHYLSGINLDDTVGLYASRTPMSCPAISDDMWLDVVFTQGVVTTFGLDITPRSIEPAKSLIASKWFMKFEHSNFGDLIAAKIYSTLCLDPVFAEIVQRAFTKYHLGNVQDYQAGLSGYARWLHSLGRNVDWDLNEYSPVEQMIASKLKTFAPFATDVDSTQSHKYSPWLVEKFINMFGRMIPRRAHVA